MKVINCSALLPFEAAQLFALVNDVEAYPSYMDGCVGAQILRSEAAVMEAELELAKGGITQRFTTRNHLSEPTHIELELVDGPFEHFNGRWDFLQLGDAGCKMSLNLEFKINSTLLGAAASKLFEKVSSNLVDDISQRANYLYG